jgi:pentatricopeptide repeat protein
MSSEPAVGDKRSTPAAPDTSNDDRSQSERGKAAGLSGAGKYGGATGQTAEGSCTACGAGKYRVETGGSAESSCTACGPKLDQAEKWIRGLKRDGEARDLTIEEMEHKEKAVTAGPSATPLGTCPQATEEKMQVVQKMAELQKENDWLALLAMEGEALQIADDMCASSPSVSASIYEAMGSCNRLFAQYDKAIKQHRQCMDIWEKVGYRVGHGMACNNLANCYCELGQYDRAIDLYMQALDTFEDRLLKGKVINGLANCYDCMGQFNKAIELYKQDLATAKELGDLAGQGRAYNGIGNCYCSLGQVVRMCVECARVCVCVCVCARACIC